MAITLGAEIDLSMHLDNSLTYADVENALVDAGFTNYGIMRNQNSDGSNDLQIYVRSADGSGLNAAETLQALTTALTALQSAEAGE